MSDKGGLKRELSFQVPAGAVNQALDGAYAQVARSAKLKGFRAGKVPRQVLKSRFGAEVEGQVLQKLVPDFYRQALAKADVEPLTNPEFGPFELTEGQPLNVVATVEVKPRITLAAYAGIALTATDPGVHDDDVAVAHRSLREAMATLEPAPDGHAAASGDVAVIDFLGKVDGVPFEGGEAKGYSLSLGDGRFIPGFEDQVIGHKAGDRFDISVTFPEDYHAQDLKGRDAVFEITLHEIKNKVLPPVDDAFATQVGDFADLAALNGTLREEIRAKRESDQNRAHRHEVFVKLAEANRFEVPEAWIAEEIGNIVDHRRRMAAVQGQALPEPSEEEKAQLRDDAILQARGRLVITEIAKAEGIEVTDQEFSREIARLAQEYQRSAEEIMQLIRSNPAETHRLGEHLLKNKVLDWVIAKANVTVVPRGGNESAG
ncbi:MAG: trigger factor [Nitrospirae bacterium]|nr:trigger factor [Nitrospirota bacterium]